MSVFVLISCSYIWNEFKDTVDEMKHEGEKKRRIPKNDDYAIRNPNYTDDVKKLLKEIEKREINMITAQRTLSPLKNSFFLFSICCIF